MRLTAGSIAALLVSVVGYTATPIAQGPQPTPGTAKPGSATPRSPTTPTQTGSAVPRGGAPDKITVTGCLQRAEQASTPATGTTGAQRVPPGSFVLINAKTVASGDQPADVTTYILEGGSLAANVGQAVEVDGTVTRGAITTPGTTAPAERHEAGTVTAETPGSVTPSGTGGIPRIRVASVRGTGGDCSTTR